MSNDPSSLTMAAEAMGAAGFGITPGSECTATFVNGYAGYLVEQRIPEEGFKVRDWREDTGCNKSFKELTS